MVNLIKASVIMLLTGKPAGIALCSEQSESSLSKGSVVYLRLITRTSGHSGGLLSLLYCFDPIRLEKHFSDHKPTSNTLPFIVSNKKGVSHHLIKLLQMGFLFRNLYSVFSFNI
jgi:hypothetical protein